MRKSERYRAIEDVCSRMFNVNFSLHSKAVRYGLHEDEPDYTEDFWQRLKDDLEAALQSIRAVMDDCIDTEDSSLEGRSVEDLLRIQQYYQSLYDDVDMIRVHAPVPAYIMGLCAALHNEVALLYDMYPNLSERSEDPEQSEQDMPECLRLILAYIKRAVECGYMQYGSGRYEWIDIVKGNKGGLTKLAFFLLNAFKCAKINDYPIGVIQSYFNVKGLPQAFSRASEDVRALAKAKNWRQNMLHDLFLNPIK